MLYFLDKDEETIGLVKTKTIWYIMLRALREKLIYTTRRRQGWSLQDRIESTHKRFMEIKEWLHFSDNYLNGWKVRNSCFCLCCYLIIFYLILPWRVGPYCHIA